MSDPNTLEITDDLVEIEIPDACLCHEPTASAYTLSMQLTNAAQPAGLSTLAKVAIGGGVLGGLGLVAWYLRKRRGRKP